MFSFRNDPGADGVGVAFCDAVAPGGARLDLADRAGRPAPGWALVEEALGVPVLHAHQVHGVEVLEVGADTSPGGCATTEADALVTREAGIGIAVRVADCLPVLLADPAAGVVAAAHAGRVGLAAGVLPATLARMRALGARRITAWIGPHVCGACYEVPEQLRAEVAAGLAGAWATTSWGTPALDLGGAASVQLEAAGCSVRRHDPCTLETPTLHSHRRDAAAAGRQAGVIWLPRAASAGR
ncbi:MAG: polyphenol oxidase family protein [Propionicimonas sp.]|nr:polyphenol oxidase family protein [Propionicimonas sp.]